MKKYISLVILYSLMLLDVSGSAYTSLGTTITEVRLKTLISDNGFTLTQTPDENTLIDMLSGMKVHWQGKDIIIDVKKLVPIKMPLLRDAVIKGIENSKDTMILIIPYNIMPEDEDDIPVTSYDAVKVVFTNGILISCETSTAINKERNKWQISAHNIEKKKIEPVNTYNSKRNYFLE